MRNLAIIPARSGSKGVKDKNVRNLNGRPLIAYTISAALDSAQFDTVMVSTDCERYAEIAESYGAKVPFFRSEKNSEDTASSWDTVEEVIHEFGKKGETFDTFCLLQPTSPLRRAEDIISAYNLYNEKEAFSVVSVTEVEHPIDWCGTIGTDLSLDGFVNRKAIAQRQSMPKHYRPNGAIYIANILGFLEDQFLYRKRSYAYYMPKERSIDIDTESDFRFAEFMMKEDGREVL